MSKAIYLNGGVPEGPVPLDEVLRRWPQVRQSVLANFDDCELSALFALRYENGWSTHPQARGTIFHRFAAESLREMQRTDSTFIPVGTALAILEETCYQRNVALEDIVRVPLREMPDLEMAAIKFANDNRFNIRDIIDVERRLTATLSYEGPDGQIVKRTLTGALDALIARGADEAIVLDWKTGWALPPERDENAEDPGLSYHGFFQQQFYAWLVMMTWPGINAVTLREFFVYRTKARPARVTRADLPKIEQRLRYVLASFDRAIAAGEPQPLKKGRKVIAPPLSIKALEAHGSWKPSPGYHCRWCTQAFRCPIDDDYKVGATLSAEDASRMAGARAVMKASIKKIDEALRPYVDVHGEIPIKRSKGRRVLGYRKIKGGFRWEEYTPKEADRPTTVSTLVEQGESEVTGESFADLQSPDLTGAMKAATERAREARKAGVG